MLDAGSKLIRLCELDSKLGIGPFFERAVYEYGIMKASQIDFRLSLVCDGCGICEMSMDTTQGDHKWR